MVRDFSSACRISLQNFQQYIIEDSRLTPYEIRLINFLSLEVFLRTNTF